MKYTYKQSLYYNEAICCLVLSAVIGMTMANTYDRTIGFGVVLAGCVISALFHLFGQSRNRFVFAIQNDGLLISYHRQSAKITWGDIENIREDDCGLHIKCCSLDAEIPILHDLDGYDSFCQQVMNKAHRQYEQWR